MPLSDKIFVGAFFRKCSNALQPVSDELASEEALQIFESTLNINKRAIILTPKEEIAQSSAEIVERVIEERLTGKPLAQILRKKFFYNKEFHVSEDTLIPRPDTEVIVHTILTLEKLPNLKVFEIGTGSGIIPGSLSFERDSWKILSVDISEKALAVARQNCPESVDLIAGDLFSAVKEKPLFDIFVSNPPYIPSSVISTLDESVAKYEPLNALDGGVDGLDFYRIIAVEAPKRLLPGGRIYLEIGWDQGETVPKILEEANWENVKLIKDLGGRARVVSANIKVAEI